MAQVTIRALKKAYGAVQVVHGLDLDIADGEFVVLVGPSGCGKSTLLRMLAGLEEITSGDILIGERRVNNLPPSERDIAMVFQNYALYPHKTVAANMGFALKMRGMDKAAIAEKVKRAAEILGLTPYLDRYPRALSGGQRQRVAIARALATHPKIVLADEPTANLDHKTGEGILALMKDINLSFKTTFIFSTHDKKVMAKADRLVRVEDGQIRALGVRRSRWLMVDEARRRARAQSTESA